MPCYCSFFLFDGYLTGELFSLLCGVYFEGRDVSGAIYKIGKKGEFLPKLYFFGSSGLDLFFLCSGGVYLRFGGVSGLGGFRKKMVWFISGFIFI